MIVGKRIVIFYVTATQQNECITKAGKCFTANAGPADGLSWFKANQLCKTAGGRLLQVRK